MQVGDVQQAGGVAGRLEDRQGGHRGVDAADVADQFLQLIGVPAVVVGDAARVTEAAARFIEWLETIPAHGPIGLVGFSQGASIAIQAMRLDPGRFAFLVNLSGYAAPGELPGDPLLAERRPPAFWGRGTHDDVLPEALIEHTIQWLPGHVDLSGRVYQGLTHSVSQQEVEDVRIFLEKRLAQMASD